MPFQKHCSVDVNTVHYLTFSLMKRKMSGGILFLPVSPSLLILVVTLLVRCAEPSSNPNGCSLCTRQVWGTRADALFKNVILQATIS